MASKLHPHIKVEVWKAKYCMHVLPCLSYLQKSPVLMNMLFVNVCETKSLMIMMLMMKMIETMMMGAGASMKMSYHGS